MNNRIENASSSKAPVSRVWRALTDHREFGEWFRVKPRGPFVAGQLSQGQITHPATSMSAGRVYRRIEPRVSSASLASVRHRSEGGLLEGATHAGRVPAAADRQRNFAAAHRVRLRQSAREPPRGAFRMNDGGWTQQMKNIESHVAHRQ